MQKLTATERLLQKKLGRLVRLTGGSSPTPSEYAIKIATRVYVSPREWLHGTCKKVLLFTVGSEQILLIKIVSRPQGGGTNG